jgi:hypothetical protein
LPSQATFEALRSHMTLGRSSEQKTSKLVIKLDARCARGALKRQKSRGCREDNSFAQPHRLTGTYTEGGKTS